MSLNNSENNIHRMEIFDLIENISMMLCKCSSINCIYRHNTAIITCYFMTLLKENKLHLILICRIDFEVFCSKSGIMKQCSVYVWVRNQEPYIKTRNHHFPGIFTRTHDVDSNSITYNNVLN